MDKAEIASFHANLVSKGKGAKDWGNSWTEHEYLGVNEEGKHRFGVTINGNHKVFKDKTDNLWKKRKLTDNSPDYVVIQSARCCVEVYPYYAKFYDVHHEEVRVEEERWIVQRLFKEPDTWRDVDTYNPVMSVEENESFIKVTVTYNTAYGPFTLEYLQRDGGALKHTIFFQNTSSEAETFRVIQRWSGITGEKVNGETIIKKKKLTGRSGHRFTFHDSNDKFMVGENSQGLMQKGIRDILEMHTGSRESIGKTTVFDKNNVKLTVVGNYVSLVIGEHESMSNNDVMMSLMAASVEECPFDARVFVGGLGLGVILHLLTLSRKTSEIVVCEINQTVIDEVFPAVQNYLLERYPGLNLSIIHGDAEVEVTKHGTFDWIFMDYLEAKIDTALPYLNEGGVYTPSSDIVKLNLNRVPYIQAVEVDTHPRGIKADFIYGDWVLEQNKALEIDPATITLSNPTEDGQVTKRTIVPPGSTVDCLAIAPLRNNSSSFIRWGQGSMYYFGYRGYVEWDISTLTGATLTANPDLLYEGNTNTATDSEINPVINYQPSDGGTSDLELWDEIAVGVAYVDPFNVVVNDNQSQDLGAQAQSDLQDAIDALQSWFAIGFQSAADECLATGGQASEIVSEEEGDPTPPPSLYLEYTAAGGASGAGAVVMGTESLILDLLLEGVI